MVTVAIRRGVRRLRLDAGGEIARVVTAEAAAAERARAKSCSVLNPRKSIVLSVISKRASGWRFVWLAELARAKFAAAV